MWAAVYDRLGPAREVLAVRELPTPTPQPGEVRVRVTLSGVNPSDCKARQYGRGAPFVLQVPHSDGVGRVDAVGEGVAQDRIGERVWLWNAAWMRPYGTAAQYICLPEHQAVPLPDHVSDEQAAGLGIPFMTAWHCLFSEGSVQGLEVLVAGGAGAVGNAAVQLARYAGARVIATVSSPEKARIAIAAGADVTVDYRSIEAVEMVRAAAPSGVHRIIELALGANLEFDLAVLREHGTIMTYAPETTPPTIPTQRLMRDNVSLRFMLVYTIGAAAQDAAVRGVQSALRDGALIPLPTLRFSLAEVALAHEAVEASSLGKVVVEVL